MRFCRLLACIAATSLLVFYFLDSWNIQQQRSVRYDAVSLQRTTYRRLWPNDGEHATSGKLLRNFTTDGQPESPTVVNGIIYVVSRKDITDNNGFLTAVSICMHAINAANGAKV